MNILNKLEAKCKRISLKSGHLEGAVTFFILHDVNLVSLTPEQQLTIPRSFITFCDTAKRVCFRCAAYPEYFRSRQRLSCE